MKAYIFDLTETGQFIAAFSYDDAPDEIVEPTREGPRPSTHPDEDFDPGDPPQSAERAP